LRIVEGDGFARTDGLERDLGQPDILIPYTDADLKTRAAELCEQLVTYCKSTGARIAGDEKVGWATNVILFKARDGFLEAHSLNRTVDEFEHGADSVLRNWSEQLLVCKQFGSKYEATHLEQMVIVSLDLIDGSGKVHEGARYPHKSPTSGWWLFGDRYSGNIETMKKIHVGHVVSPNSDIVKYLALDSGFCFRKDGTPLVWFEQDIAKFEAL
jgi:hypothetical protein